MLTKPSWEEGPSFVKDATVAFTVTFDSCKHSKGLLRLVESGDGNLPTTCLAIVFNAGTGKNAGRLKAVWAELRFVAEC